MKLCFLLFVLFCAQGGWCFSWWCTGERKPKIAPEEKCVATPINVFVIDEIIEDSEQPIVFKHSRNKFSKIVHNRRHLLKKISNCYHREKAILQKIAKLDRGNNFFVLAVDFHDYTSAIFFDYFPRGDCEDFAHDLIQHKYFDCEEIFYGLAIQVAAAIEYLHQNKIMHRDIKPANILVGHRNGLNRYLLCDFGSAKVLGHNLDPQKHGFAGTENYRAPEVSLGIYDERVDVYSFGATIFRLLHKCNRRVCGVSVMSKLAGNFCDLAQMEDPRQRPDMATLRQHRWLAGH